MPKRRTVRLDALVVCPPGLEAVTSAELAALGLDRLKTEKGAVSCRPTVRQLYAANVSLRTATRVLVRVAAFSARGFAELERKVQAIDWGRWIGPEVRPVFRVTSHSSTLWHQGAIEQRVAAAVPRSPGADAPEQLVVVRATHDKFVVSIDASGRPLHERGWRQETAKAPLRESVAAGLLLASGWDRVTPLVDPFCGSGTIPIEAALLASGAAPGRARRFAFQDWPCFQPGTWGSVKGEADGRAGGATPPIVASDRDAGAIEAARANAERAGVVDAIEFRVAAISDLRSPGEIPGWLITNLPWGGRTSTGKDLRNLYASLGNTVRAHLPLWRLGILVADRDLARQVGPDLESRLALEPGGQNAWFLTGELS